LLWADEAPRRFGGSELSTNDQAALSALTDALEAKWKSRIKVRRELLERDKEVIDRFKNFIRESLKAASSLTKEIFIVKFERLRQDLNTSRNVELASIESETNKERNFGALSIRLDVTKSNFRLNGKKFKREAGQDALILKVAEIIEVYCGPDAQPNEPYVDDD
jgi:hypothetical protein